MRNALIAALCLFLGFGFGVASASRSGCDNGEILQRDAQTYGALVREFYTQRVINNIIYCESRGVHDRTSNKGAYGVAQFMDYTFDWMKGLAGRPELVWENEEDQLWLLEWAIRNGYGKHWQFCYRQAISEATEDFIAEYLPTSSDGSDGGVNVSGLGVTQTSS